MLADALADPHDAQDVWRVLREATVGDQVSGIRQHVHVPSPVLSGTSGIDAIMNAYFATEGCQ